MITDNSEARRIVRIASGSFRDDGFAAQHDYGKVFIAWKDIEVLFLLSFEKKAASSVYLMFFVYDNPSVYYLDGGATNYRIMLKQEYTGKPDIDFSLLLSKFEANLIDTYLDPTIQDFRKGGSAFLPAFKTLQKVSEYAESVRARAQEELREQAETGDSESFTVGTSKRWEVDEIISGSYRVHKFLQGGMGIVYIVSDVDSEKLYAIKTFQDQFLWNRKIIRMFVREAEVWVKLGKHRNIVQAEYVRNIDGKPYIFLEFIDGFDLGSLLKKEPLDIMAALDFSIQFCSGMIFANEKLGIIHRDIKPSNCMITSDGILKITDFGLVQIFHERTGEELKGDAPPLKGDVRITQTGAFKGTIPYMAPERFRDSEAEIQSDIYSFGVMLYEMLTAQKPITGESMDEWMTRHQNVIPRSPSELNNSVPDDLSSVTLKCLEKNPVQRYKDFRDLRQEIIRVYERLAGDPYPLEDEVEVISVEQWLTNGNSLEALEQYKEALISFEHALKLDSNCAAGWHGKARTLAFLGKHQQAVECYEKAIALNPRDAKIWYDKGNLLFQLNAMNDALHCYDTAIRTDPGLAEVWNKKGLLMDIAGQTDEAIRCYDESLKINARLSDAWNNKGNLLYKLKRFEEAEKCYDEALTINPRYARSWYNKGNIASIHVRLQEALDYYQKALDIEPAYTQASIGKGLTYIRLNQMTEAIGAFDTGLSTDPSNLNLMGLKATTLYTRGRFADTISCYESMLKLDPRNSKALMGCAQVYTRISAFERALHYINEVVNAEPENRLALELLDDIKRLVAHKKKALEPIRAKSGWVRDNDTPVDMAAVFAPFEQRKEKNFWGRILKKNTPQAEQDETYASALEHYQKAEYIEALGLVDQAIQLNPQSREAWKLAADIFGVCGYPDKAMECRLVMLDREQQSPDYWTAKGEIIEKAGKYYEALLCYQYALVLNPRHLKAAIDAVACMEELGFSDLARFQALEILETSREDFQKNTGRTLYLKIYAMLSMLLGVHKEALRFVEGGLRIDPGEVPLHLLKGRILGEQGKVQDEIRLYTELLRTNPQNPWLLIARGRALEKDFRVQEAQRTLDMAAEKLPDSEAPWYYRSLVSMNLNDYEESLKCINKLLELKPLSVRGWILKGIQMRRNQKLEEALWAFNKASEMNPENADAHKNRGIMLLNLGRHREALTCFETINEMDVENFDTWILKAMVLQKLEDYDRALECCSRSLAINPRSAEAMVVLGSTLMLLERNKEALSWIGKALRVDNRCISAWIDRGILLMNGGNRDESIQSFDKAVEINPDYALAWYNRGVSLAMTGKSEKSLESIDKALMLNVKFFHAWYNRGNILLSVKKPDEALKSFDKALELNQKDARVWCLKGINLMEIDNYAEALKVLTRAHKMDSSMGETIVNKGISLLKLGRTQEAEECFSEASLLSPQLKGYCLNMKSRPSDEPLIPPNHFGPFIEDNPEFQVFLKQESYMQRELLAELFPA